MNLDKSPTGVDMTDGAVASELIRQVAGPSWGDSKKVLLERAYAALSRINDRWTRRRVRALWDGEAARVELREVREMIRAARDRERLEEARREHKRYIEETARLATLLERQDADFHGPSIAALRRVPGGVDSSGTEGGE